MGVIVVKLYLGDVYCSKVLVGVVVINGFGKSVGFV